MSSGNVEYTSRNIPDYFKSNRRSWDQFYPSERLVIEKFSPGPQSKVLDMGCACGGLASALQERFGIQNYTGVDIHSEAISVAKTQVPWARFIAGDFLKHSPELALDFDLCFSLSCADWNVETAELFSALFRHVRDSGRMIFTCRLSNLPLPKGVVSGRQKIEYPNSTDQTIEWAPYKVFTLPAMMQMLLRLSGLSEIYGYGYWGPTPKTVERINIDRIFYMVFALTKGKVPSGGPRVQLDSAADFFV